MTLRAALQTHPSQAVLPPAVLHLPAAFHLLRPPDTSVRPVPHIPAWRTTVTHVTMLSQLISPM